MASKIHQVDFVKYICMTMTLVLQFSCANRDYRSEGFNSYPPRIVVMDSPGAHEIQIPVEIELKNGKQSFIEIFRYYGFSGNGPSIEQVIRYNLRYENAEYDSEGDCFRVVFSSKDDLDRYHLLLKPVTNEDGLHRWVYNARKIFFKE